MLKLLPISKNDGEGMCSIYVSIVCYTCFFSYGYFACSLGATLTEVAHLLNEDETTLGVLFSARGFGFMLGTFLYNFVDIHNKELLISCSVLLAGVCSIIIIYTDSLLPLLSIVFVQSMLFCGVDLTSNILLTLTWGDCVPPYLQMLHFSWSFGGIVGPFVVGKVGYHMSNKILLCICTIPMVLYVFNKYHLNLLPLSTSTPHLNAKKQIKLELESDIGELSKADNNSVSIPRQTDLKIDIESVELTTVRVRDKDKKQTLSVTGVQLDNAGDIKLSITKCKVSLALKIWFCLFYFFYVGIESGYGGWVASYINRNRNLAPVNLIHSENLTPHVLMTEQLPVMAYSNNGAYFESMFFFSMTAGRFLAIPLSTRYSPNQLMPFQLGVALFGFCLLNTASMWSNAVSLPLYDGYMISTIVIGLGISSMFPVGLTLVHDFNIHMDPQSITLCMTGAVIGETTIPLFIGQCMKYAASGDDVFMTLLCVNMCVLIGIYAVIYSLLKYDSYKNLHTK